jgi:hypothetical protein
MMPDLYRAVGKLSSLPFGNTTQRITLSLQTMSYFISMG